MHFFFLRRYLCFFFLEESDEGPRINRALQIFLVDKSWFFPQEYLKGLHSGLPNIKTLTLLPELMFIDGIYVGKHTYAEVNEQFMSQFVLDRFPRFPLSR